MVKQQILDITYRHPFAAVTTSLWSKYDGHKYVKEVDVLDRFVDSEGRLHSRRLLTMTGNLPALFRAFVPVSAVHMLETVIVDPVKQEMHVETVNINCSSVLAARSRSSYHPTTDGTRYHIDIDVRAFPHQGAKECAAQENDRAQPSDSSSNNRQSSWKVEWVMGGGDGYIAGKIESWVAKKLLGNVSRGERYIEGFCRRFRERHLALCDESAPTGVSAAVEEGASKQASGVAALKGMALLGGAAGEAEPSLGQLMAHNTRLARLVWPAASLRAAVNAGVEVEDSL